MRSNRDDSMNGFVLTPELHPVGTVVSESRGRLLRSRQQWEKLPKLEEAVGDLISHVHGEDRYDELVHFNELNMVDDGRLRLGDSIIGLEQNGFRQLCGRAQVPGGSAYLVACPPELRASNLNHWLSQADGQVKLRLRFLDEQPALFASVSPSYAVYDVPDLLAEALTMIPAESRVEASYDGLQLRFRAVFDSELRVDNVGDVFRTGVEIASADDGTGALHISTLLWRTLCTNLMLFGLERRSTVKRIHRGATMDMVAALFLGIREARNAAQSFSEMWVRANSDRVIKHHQDRQSMLERLFERKQLQTPGMRSAEAIRNILVAWNLEPGLTRSALVNAVTRSAHESPWPNIKVAERLEAQAGQLLTTQLPTI